jgi:hypothetical protein
VTVVQANCVLADVSAGVGKTAGKNRRNRTPDEGAVYQEYRCGE